MTGLNKNSYKRKIERLERQIKDLKEANLVLLKENIELQDRIDDQRESFLMLSEEMDKIRDEYVWSINEAREVRDGYRKLAQDVMISKK